MTNRLTDVRIGMVTLSVSNLARSVSFYQEVLGLKVLEQTKTEALLGSEELSLLQLIVNPNAIAKPPRTTGLYHFAILVPIREDLGSFLRHAVENRYPLDGAADHLFSEAIYLRDPEGNGIEVYADRPRSKWTYDENGEVRSATDPLDADDLLRISEDRPWQGIPLGTVMGHIHLHVAHIPETERFYCNVLGLDPMIHMQNHALFVAAGGYHHHIGLNVWNGVGAAKPPEDSVGLVVYELGVLEKDWEALMDRLQSASVYMEKRDQGIVVQDPAGNRIYVRTI